MSELFNEKQIKGITTELICMQKFIELGYIVSVPYGNNSRYDLDPNEEIPEGVVDIKVERKNIIDSNGKPAVEIKKTLTYEDGSVQNIIRKEIINEE